MELYYFVRFGDLSQWQRCFLFWTAAQNKNKRKGKPLVTGGGPGGVWLAQGHTAGWGWDGASGRPHGEPGDGLRLQLPPWSWGSRSPGAAGVSGSSSCPDPHLGCLFTQPRSSDPRPGGLSLAAPLTVPAVVNTQLQAPHVPEARSLLSCALSTHTWPAPKEFLFLYMQFGSSRLTVAGC